MQHRSSKRWKELAPNETLSLTIRGNKLLYDYNQ